MSIIGIVAIAKNLAIGKNGKLPWHYSADLKFFKQTTLNNTIVMGWNTWKEIGGKPLPKRLNVILSRSKNLENQPSLILLRNKQEVLALKNYLKGDLFLIGGAQTFADFSDVIDKWIVTEIPESPADADTFMPANFLEDFEMKEIVSLAEDLNAKIYERK
nr:Dihydrofolate reductase [uncultured bacterium]